MNRTTVYLIAAAALAVVALVMGMPRFSGTPTPNPGVPTPTPVPPAVGATTSDGSLTLTTRTSHPYIVTGDNEIFVTAEVKARHVGDVARVPVNLALVIDRSGSMAGAKLDNARKAARELVSQLSSSDRLAIVHYGTDVEAFSSVLCTPENKTALLSFIDGISENGGTNIGDGLSEGRRQLQRVSADFRVNRLILISDGQPTAGVTDPNELMRQVSDIRAQGISLSSIGVGTDFNERLMEGLAEVGSGAYAFLNNPEQLSTIFQRDLNAAATQVARNISLQFIAPEGTELLGVLGRSGAQQTRDGLTGVTRITLPDLASDQLERVIVRLKVHGSAIGSELTATSVTLAYQDLTHDNAQVLSRANVTTQVTGSAVVMDDARDKDTIVFAARAESAEKLQQAAVALENGNREEARGYLDALNTIVAKAKGLGTSSANALAGESEGIRRKFDAANDEQGQNVWRKNARVKALNDFGKEASVY